MVHSTFDRIKYGGVRNYCTEDIFSLLELLKKCIPDFNQINVPIYDDADIIIGYFVKGVLTNVQEGEKCQ